MTPLTDPTPQQLAARLDAAVGSGRDWGKVLSAIRGEPDGVVTVVPTDGTDATWRGWEVCWWRDRLGRQHWSVGTDAHRPSLASPPTAVGDCALWWHPDRHPLEWIAPPLSCGWRERGWWREFVVICRCGVVGTPESVGWMGQTCGPCFDREQEGLPPIGQPVRRAEAEGCEVEVTHGGLLLAWFDHPHQGRIVMAWEPPWTGEPTWIRNWTAGCQVTVSPDGSRYVLVAGDYHVVGDTTTGKPQVPKETVPFVRCKLAGASGARLVGAVRWDGPPAALSGETSADCYRLAVQSVGKEAGAPLFEIGGFRSQAQLPTTIYDLAGEELRFSETVPTLAVSPDGRRIFADRGNEVRAWDAGWLNCTDRLRLARGGTVSALVPLADGAVVAAGETDGSPWLMRWPPGGQGLRGWLLGPSARPPDAVVPLGGPLDRLRVTPDGRGVCGMRGGTLVFHDVRTLREVAAFRPADALSGGFAFSPDGLLVAGTQRGVAAWPWRELFGVE